MGNGYSSFRCSYVTVFDEEECSEKWGQEKPHYFEAVAPCYKFAFVAVAFLLGVVVGSLGSWKRSSELIGGFGDIRVTWQLNETFASSPTPNSEAAWLSIIPDGRGFVTHPRLAPANKALSVFHQLHCLHALQTAYYTVRHDLAHNNDPTYSDPFLEGLGVHVDLEHVQHCFDYLRQALMCAADTNLEPVDPVYKTTDGWGFERNCRNYQEVVKWAEKWRNNNDHTILSSAQDASQE